MSPSTCCDFVGTDQTVKGVDSLPADWVVSSVYGVDDGKLHQRQEYENCADNEPDVDPLDVDHTGHFVIYAFVQIDVSQPAARPCNISSQPGQGVSGLASPSVVLPGIAEGSSQNETQLIDTSSMLGT